MATEKIEPGKIEPGKSGGVDEKHGTGKPEESSGAKPEQSLSKRTGNVLIAPGPPNAAPAAPAATQPPKKET